MGIGQGSGNRKDLPTKLQYLAKAFRKDDVHSSVALMQTESFATGVNLGNQALMASYFRPNIVFLNLLEVPAAVTDFLTVITEAERLELGAVLYAPHPRAMLGQQQTINVWIRPQGPKWKVAQAHQTQDLALLLAYKLKLNWNNAHIRIITVIDNEEDKKKARKFLNEVIELARLPIDETLVIVGDFTTQLGNPPLADVNLFGVTPGREMQAYREIAAIVDTTCLFVLDSGHENIFA